MASEGYVGNFKDYVDMLFPNGLNQKAALNNLFNTHGVNMLDLNDFEGFKNEDWGEIEQKRIAVRDERQRRGTFKSNLQVDAEAEIWQIIEGLRIGKYAIPNLALPLERVYFVSQSAILNQISDKENLTTWTPEAVYRYLSALPGETIDPNLLQQCMLHEYFYAGISFIDKQRYLKFFGPAIDEARISFYREKEKYIKDLESSQGKNLDEAFEKT
ncbi:hypothetical protein L0244_33005, partial [bacterium]|nr:hypothetical protein [bacterium]